jgi:DNA modification methylase
MMDFGFYNMDCMQGMKEFPDKYFDLAIVDPPYGIDIGNATLGAGGYRSTPKQKRKAVTIGGATPFGSKSKWGGSLLAAQNLQGI